MYSAQTLLLESTVLGVIGIIVAYMAAINYKLSWNGVLAVMVATGVFNAYLVRMMKSRQILVSEGQIPDIMATIVITLASALGVLLVLAYRFGFTQGLGLSLVIGLFTSMVNAGMRMVGL